MKNMLLFLSALIVIPAWAGDAVPDTRAGVNIELKGPAKSVRALVADLEKSAAYKEAVCSTTPAKKSGKTARIKCAKADSALMEFLSQNSPAKVRWSISATVASKSISPAAICPAGCTMTNCPPPVGPVQCCNTTTHIPC